MPDKTFYRSAKNAYMLPEEGAGLLLNLEIVFSPEGGQFGQAQLFRKFNSPTDNISVGH